MGLIPAHAGKTNRPGETLSSSRAHPRSRGENAEQVKAAADVLGSSPLTRGKLAPLWVALAAAVAHPRSRGENSKLQAALNEGRGSSPLTRGKLSQTISSAWNAGLIPAHAGKTAVPRPRY